MAINFPSSPSVNQIYTYQSRSWQWDGNAWLQVRTGVASVGNEVPGGSKNGVNTVFTTAAPFITGTLRVYLNGQRLTETEDYTVGTSSITMLTAPLATDILLVDYYTHTGEIATGSASTITNEVPSGSVDGVNKVFTCAHAFVSGTLQVFRDGQLLKGGGDDYTETNPVTGTFTFVTAAVSGTTLLTCYQAALSTVGNADTLDGYHASSFMQASAASGFVQKMSMSGRMWLPWGVYINISPLTASWQIPYGATIDRTITFIKWTQAALIDAPNNASNYWTCSINRVDGGGLLAELNTSPLASGVWQQISTTVFTPATIPGSAIGLFLQVVKTGAPGNLYLFGPAVEVSV